MRVAYFAEIFPSRSETWVHHEIRELTRLGCEVRVFATWPRPKVESAEDSELVSLTRYLDEYPKFEILPGLLTLCRSRVLRPLITGICFERPSFRNAIQTLRDLARMARLLSQVRDFHPDITVCHFSGSRANLGLMLQLLDGIPFVIKSHAKDIFSGSALLSTKVKLASCFYTISRYNLDFIAEHYPEVESERIRLHACGVPLDLLAFEPTEEHESNRAPLLLSVGRLVPMKGLEFLIRASMLVRQQHPGTRVLIVGQGPEEARLEHLIRQLGLEEFVKLAGYCTPEEVRAHLRSASVSVMPCVWDPKDGSQDGIPVALMESMACGVPVISTHISGIPELIENDVSGFLAHPGDSQDLAQAIHRALSMSPANRTDMLARAREVIERNHDIRKLSRDLLDDLETIVRATPGTTSPLRGDRK
ncbi:MAG: glycosyltransferase [Myxococcota bacterium]